MVEVSPEVRTVVLFGVSGRAADEVVPADGIAAVVTVAGYDRIEARDAEGMVLTTCWDEPVDESGATCISRAGAGS